MKTTTVEAEPKRDILSHLAPELEPTPEPEVRESQKIAQQLAAPTLPTAR